MGWPNCVRSRTVRQHLVQAGLHDADPDARQHHPLVVQAGHEDAHAPPLLAHDVLGRTSQSENTSSPVSDPRIPSLSRCGDWTKPGVPFSTRKAVIPREPASGSVFA
jgi:hypothetical protein